MAATKPLASSRIHKAAVSLEKPVLGGMVLNWVSMETKGTERLPPQQAIHHKLKLTASLIMRW